MTVAPGPCLGAILASSANALATRRNNFGIVPRYRNRALFGAHSCCSDLRFLHLRRPSLRCRRRTNVSVTLSCSAIMAGSTPRAARMASSWTRCRSYGLRRGHSSGAHTLFRSPPFAE